MNIDELLRHTVERGASDLHLKVGNVPFLRIDGDLQPTSHDVLTPPDTVAFGTTVMSEHKRRGLEQHNEEDIGHTLEGDGRVRGNVFRQGGLVRLAGGRAGSRGPTVEELRLPGGGRTRG